MGFYSKLWIYCWRNLMMDLKGAFRWTGLGKFYEIKISRPLHRIIECWKVKDHWVCWWIVIEINRTSRQYVIVFEGQEFFSCSIYIKCHWNVMFSPEGILYCTECCSFVHLLKNFFHRQTTCKNLQQQFCLLSSGQLSSRRVVSLPAYEPMCTV